MNALGFIIYWQKYGCVLWFFWYWIYFSRSIKQSQRNSSRKLGQHLILIKQSTFFKKGTNNFTTPYSMPLLSVSHQNKAFHNFHKGRQHPIARHKGSRLGPSSLATYLEYRMMILCRFYCITFKEYMLPRKSYIILIYFLWTTIKRMIR